MSKWIIAKISDIARTLSPSTVNIVVKAMGVQVQIILKLGMGLYKGFFQNFWLLYKPIALVKAHCFCKGPWLL